MQTATYSVPKLRNANMFLQTRARLQRLGDLKFFSGWVESIDYAAVRIRLKASKNIASRGEEFSVEISGKEHTAVFMGKVDEVYGAVIDLRVAKGIALLPKKENARVSVFGVQGRLFVDEAEYACTVVDVSDTGLGVVVTSALEPASIASFEIFSPLGAIEGAGEVRYCREDPEVPDQFRVGIQLTELGRIERARWNHLISSESSF